MDNNFESEVDQNLNILLKKLTKNNSFDEVILKANLNEKQRIFVKGFSDELSNNMSKYRGLVKLESLQLLKDLEFNKNLIISSVPETMLNEKMSDFLSLVKKCSNKCPNGSVNNLNERNCFSHDNKQLDLNNAVHMVNRILFDLNKIQLNKEKSVVSVNGKENEENPINNNRDKDKDIKNILTNINPNNYSNFNPNPISNPNCINKPSIQPTTTNNIQHIPKKTPKATKLKTYSSDSDTKSDSLVNKTPCFGGNLLKSKTITNSNNINKEYNSQKIKSFKFSNKENGEANSEALFKKAKPISCQNKEIKMFNQYASNYHSPSPAPRRHQQKIKINNNYNSDSVHTPQKKYK